MRTTISLASITISLFIQPLRAETDQWVKTLEPHDSGYNFQYFRAKNGIIWALPGLARSDDGGKSWLELKEMENHDDVDMVDAHWGFATFNRPLLVKFSTDGGKHWEDLHSKESEDVPSILRFSSRRNGIGIGEFIHKTADGGKTWRTVYDREPITTPFSEDVFFLDNKHGWIADLGRVLLTADGGDTWEEHSTGPLTFYPQFLQFVDRKHGWLLTNQSEEEDATGRVVLKRSKDGGKTWETAYETQVSTMSMFNAFFFKDRNEGWLAGPGIMRHTRDGGTTWSEFPAPPSSSARVALYYGKIKSEEFLLIGTNEGKPDAEDEEHGVMVHWHDFGFIYRMSLSNSK